MPSADGLCLRLSSSAMTCATPGVCTTSGKNAVSAMISATSLAMIACVGFAGRILHMSINAPTLSPVSCSVTLLSSTSSRQSLSATRMAKASQTCCPSGEPIFKPNTFSSSAVSGDEKCSTMRLSLESQPPSPQRDALFRVPGC